MNKKYDKKLILFLLLAPFFLFLFSGVAEAATLGWIGNEGVGMRIANNWKTTDVLDYLSGEYIKLEDRHVYAKIWWNKENNEIKCRRYNW